VGPFDRFNDRAKTFSWPWPATSGPAGKALAEQGATAEKIREVVDGMSR
jgi:hypothetical protein